MIHALPGMGADRRMYPREWADLSNFRAHDWVRHAGEQTIPEVARSMAEACHIQDGDVLVGSSLGGMVACEITKIRRIPKLFLIGSALGKDEVSALLAALHPLAKYLPIEWVRMSAGSIPLEFSQMFAGIEGSFVRSMCAAIFQWEGGASRDTLVCRIHGKYDLVIPPPPNPDLMLAGGHLLSITHARACAAFIRVHGNL